MHLGKTSKKRVGSCPEKNIYQGSNNGSHGSSVVTVLHENSVEINKNLVKNTVSNKQFRTRFVCASKHKVTHIEALMATPKAKAIQVGLDALKRLQTKVQTKKECPLGKKCKPIGKK